MILLPQLITCATLGSNKNNAGVTSLNTDSVSPNPWRLEILWVTTRTASGDPNHATATGCNLTWVEVLSVNYDATGSQKRLTALRAMGSAPSSGVIAIDFAGQTQSDVLWFLDELSGVDTSGSNGAGAVVQSKSNFNTGGANLTLTVTLDNAFSNVNNASYGSIVFGQGSPVVESPGSGFTKISGQQQTSNLTGITEFKNSNDTTIDATLDSIGGEVGGIGMEIKAALRPTPDQVRQAIKRSYFF